MPYTHKNILLGVSGGIAAYKSASLASMLVKENYNTQVIMTQNATQFVGPVTFDALTKNRCITDTFDRMHSYEIEHVSIADSTDLVIIAPASANIIGKLANGIADDMLTTTVMACSCKKLIAPAMNTNMYENPILQENLKKLEAFGYVIIGPQSGNLACGSVGMGKMSEPEEIMDYVRYHTADKDLEGKRILVTAGATREAIDPVRFLTNGSTGKMGCAVAEAAALRGADVTLVHGSMMVKPPRFVKTVSALSAHDMYETVTGVKDDFDIIIMTAAVADFTPDKTADDKIKKSEDMELTLKKTKDILKSLGESKRPGQILCGFSMETRDLIANSGRKLTAKNLDMICANNLKTEGAGFGTDTNVLSLITKEGVSELPKMTKRMAADEILDRLRRMQ